MHNMVTLPGDCHATLAMTNSVLYGMMGRGNGENGTCKMARHNAK